MSADFLDTNVLVYLFDETDGPKRKTAEQLVAASIETGQAIISHQVVQETLNVLMSKLDPPMTPWDARRFLDSVLAPMWQVLPGVELYQRAIVVRERYNYGFYDALIIAAALQAGCKTLYSEDLRLLLGAWYQSAQEDRSRTS